jgi:hypothetical protein
MDNELASVLRAKQKLQEAAAELAAHAEQVRDEQSRLEYLRLTLKCQELEQLLNRLASERGAKLENDSGERRSG